MSTLPFLVIGFLVGRGDATGWHMVAAWVFAPPVVVWAVHGVGCQMRWWCDRPGEALVHGTLFLISIGLASATVGLVVARRR